MSALTRRLGPACRCTSPSSASRATRIATTLGAACATAWSKAPPGSAPARLLRLLRARLVTLAVGAPMGRPAHWVPSHTASGARTSRLQSCPSPRLRPSRRERAAEMHETDTVVRLPSFVTRPVHSSTLTSPSFRRLADQGRSLTASAPPGVRPPCARKRSLLVCYESDHGEPRRESSSPLIRPPVRPLP